MNLIYKFREITYYVTSIIINFFLLEILIHNLLILKIIKYNSYKFIAILIV